MFQIFMNKLQILPICRILFLFLFASFGITNYSYSYSYRSWLRESIPIPISRKNNYLLITDFANSCTLGAAPLWYF